jgi:hypothetical protein
MARAGRGVGEQVRRAIVRALGLGGVAEAVEAAREAAARAGVAAAAAEAAARRAEEAADAATRDGVSEIWRNALWDNDLRVAERGDGLPESGRGAAGRAWRELDNDIETLD